MAEKFDVCDNCGSHTIKPTHVNNRIYCPNCTENSPEIKKNIEELRERIESIFITTTNSIDGYKIVEYKGIESFVYVTGTGLYSELTGSISDLLGRRSIIFENKIQEAENIAIFGLKRKALEKDANAIIGVDIDFTEFSHNRNGVIISGTLVKIMKI
jgi:uncharacterized protein YbjQ (UPF0145 family)